MNEVRISTAPIAKVAQLSASQPARAQDVKTLSTPPAPIIDPAKVEPLAPIAPEDKQQQIQTAVTSMTEYVQSIKRDLQFSVDEDTGRTVVKVLDNSTGDLIRQIPDETFLELARKLIENGDVQFFDALG